MGVGGGGDLCFLATLYWLASSHKKVVNCTTLLADSSLLPLSSPPRPVDFPPLCMCGGMRGINIVKAQLKIFPT